MKRDEFLKTLAVATGAAIVTPQLLKAENNNLPADKVRVAIDQRSISGLIMGGRRLSCVEVLDIYHETGFLIYSSYDRSGVRCNAPTVIYGEVEVIDISKK